LINKVAIFACKLLKELTMRTSFLFTAAAASSLFTLSSAKQPNIIIILADDLGYGDVSAHGSTTITTPNFDRLATGGVRFMQGYATSATSTPSRYGLFTGMYPWKNKDAAILPGDAPLIISETQFTLPKMLQKAGYATAAIGKWHLGMGMGNNDWNDVVKPGAREVGFDYSNLIAATNDRTPTVYVENGRVVGLDPADPLFVSYDENFEGEPTGKSHPHLLKMHPAVNHGHDQSIHNGISRIGYQKGGKSAMWTDEDMADYFTELVKDFIDDNIDQPFFVYYGLHQPHVPRAPHSRFVGASGMGPRGDAILEADWSVGAIIDHLEKNGLLENTLIFFSSDNGPVLDDGYQDDAVEKLGDHQPAGGLRGGKYSLFEAGTRVPFFVYWKGTIRPSVSQAIVSQLDIMTSLASLVGQPVPKGLDSENYLRTFLGKSKRGRDEVVLEAQGRIALRKGDWVYIPAYPGRERNITQNELGNIPTGGLFNLKRDPAQQDNRIDKNKRKARQMQVRFDVYAKDNKHRRH
jgi:arylsulfatase A-like enzyme